MTMRKIKFEYKITVAYLVIGGTWIIFSDKLLNSFFKDSEILTAFQTYKGWFYVLITAWLFYSFLKQHLKKLRAAELKALESDRLKTAFLQNISHEIRTPMNGIIGFAELLRNKDLTFEQTQKYIEIIRKSSNRLLGIINEVVDISLIESGNLKFSEQEVHLNDFMKDVFASFSSLVNKDVVFSLSNGLTDTSCSIYTDETKVRHVLTNLLGNAIKFTSKGHIRFGYELRNNFIEFFVEDTGIGISPHQLTRVFERFQKSELDAPKLYDGLGLGLTISKGIVDFMKGEIWVESELNKGSSFFFSIPYMPFQNKAVLVS